jgi:hypothetical protein
MSPIIDGDLVIVSAAISSWGTQANRHTGSSHSTKNGEIIWVASPGASADTAHAALTIAPSTVSLAHRRYRRRRHPALA